MTRRSEPITRRELTRRGLAAGGLALLPGFPAFEGDRPRGFPPDIPVARERFDNWAGVITADGLWTATPHSPEEVVAIVEWARRADWTVRPRGAMHGWSPLAITDGTPSSAPTVLVDVTGLKWLSMAGDTAVRAGAGVTMLELLAYLERHGLGLQSVPATGDPTVGGALAIGAHGAALPAVGERPDRFDGFGSLSNLAVELTAVVWDRGRRRHVLRTFRRDERQAAALLCCLGRALITEVVLRASPHRALRCQSFTDVPAAELFAAPGSRGRTFASYLAASGRVESIWFPFTESPWLKVWTPTPTAPPGARVVEGPYNYSFSDSIPEPGAELGAALVRENGESTPAFGRSLYQAADAALTATDSRDLWGAAKNLQLYIRASTLRVDEAGFAILTSRANVQRVLHVVAGEWERRLAAERAAGRFPVNGPLELRVCATDDPRVSGVRGARVPTLAATAPRRDRRRWDVVVWANPLSLPRTAGWYSFCRGMERFLLRRFNGRDGLLRYEWSKSWAFTEDAAWADDRILRRTIPARVSAGRRPDDGWRWAVAQLDALDPHRVYGNAFLDGFLTKPAKVSRQ